jgi:hypothetical protein
MKTKVPTRRDSPRERIFTKKINCGLNKLPNSLAREPKEKQDKILSTYQTKQRRMENKIPWEFLPSS